MVLVARRVVRVADDLVGDRLLLAGEQFLEGDDGGKQQSDLTDQQGFTSNQSDGSKDEGQESSGLQLQHQQQGK